MTAADARHAAQASLDALVPILHAHAAGPLIEECEHLKRAVSAFHLEAIRFRMFNVDRMLTRLPGLPPDARRLYDELRAALEEAGFHTRSH